MSLVLHPRAAPGDRLQVWVGAFDRTSPPSLRWFLDGQEVTPNPLRSLTSARKVSDLATADESRVFTGVYEFDQGITPGSVHEVQALASGAGRTDRSVPLRVTTLPARVPDRMDTPFNILLVSCFHQYEDKGGLAGNLVSQLPAAYRPHLTLLLGDQVYLDLPPLVNFRDNEKWLARKFEEDYTANWWHPKGSDPGYSRILDVAPHASVPDDHEYWNNAPHASPAVQNSWTPEGRQRWVRAARALYEAFQLSQPGGYQDPLVIDVPPLSIFLMDNRSFRTPDRRSTLPAGVLPKFQAWADRVVREEKHAVLITGQSLFQEPVKELQGKIFDRHLSNYGDYTAIMTVVARLSQARRPVLCITGDVHYGRVTVARNLSAPDNRLCEVISSPSSLVTTPGADQFAQLKNAFRGLFGKKDPWPRHSDAEKPPPVFSPAGFGGKLQCEMLFPRKGEKGNHLALLSFWASGFGLEMRVTYWIIDRSGRIGPPHELRPFSSTLQ